MPAQSKRTPSSAASRDPGAWLEQSRKRWAILVQGAVWILGIVGGFLTPPPVGVAPGDEKMWLRLAQFIIAVVVGALFYATLKWRLRKHARGWWVMALSFLMLSVVAFFVYQYALRAWTAAYDGEWVVTGSDYTEFGRRYAEENPELSRELLVMHFAGQTKDLWTRTSIDRRRLLLAAVYMGCLPLFTICLMSIIQAIQCLAPVKDAEIGL